MNPTSTSAKFDNPFRASRLNHSSDFKPEWDVDTINRDASDWLATQIKKVRGQRKPDPSQLIPVLLSNAGYGKSHILARLVHSIGNEAFFVFIEGFPDPRRPLDHIRWTIVERLFSADPGNISPLHQALADLFHSSFIEGVKSICKDSDQRDTLLRSLDGNPSFVIEFVKRTTKLASFRKLAASTAARLPHIRASVIRALVLGWSPAAHLARRWLRGEKLSEEEAQITDLIEESPNPMEVLNAVSATLDYQKPVVICCDQIESVMKDPNGPRQLGIHLTEILAGVPNLYVTISCLESAWHDLYRPQLSDAFLRRTRDVRLAFPNQDQAIALVEKRLRTWPQRDPKQEALWPFDRVAMERFTRDEMPRPGTLIRMCEDAMDLWAAGKLIAPFPIGTGSEAPKATATELFEKLWLEELARITEDPRRQPDEMQDARIFASLKEVMLLVKSAGENWPGLWVQLVKEPVLAEAASYPRYGMRIEIRDPGKAHHSVIAGVTTLTGGISLFYYIRELSSAIRTSAGGILLHPRRELTLGAVARRTVDRLIADGKLVVLSLAEHRATFNQLECVMSLLDQARSGGLVLGSTAITYEKCQELLRETKVLEDAALFKTLAKWNPPAGAVASGPVKETRGRATAKHVKVDVEPKPSRVESTTPEQAGRQSKKSTVVAMKS